MVLVSITLLSTFENNRQPINKAVLTEQANKLIEQLISYLLIIFIN